MQYIRFRKSVETILKMLVQVSSSNDSATQCGKRNYYEQVFEDGCISDTRKFYSCKAQQFLARSAHDYAFDVDVCFALEKNRVTYFVDFITGEKIEAVRCYGSLMPV